MKLRFAKRIAKHPFTQAALCALVALYIRLTVWTMWIQREVAPEAEAYLNGEKQAIYAFWHGRMFLFTCFKPKKHAIKVLISGHNDGLLISRVIAWFDMGTVEGSSNRNSLSALRGLLKAVKAGDNIAITPDGPRGPRESVAAGIAYMAKATSLPIIPAAWSGNPCKRFRSWDRFMVGLPFSRAVLLVGMPLVIAAETSDEEACAFLASELSALTRRADAQMGVVD